jgi:capsular polysaccharide biosynthesis protein
MLNEPEIIDEVTKRGFEVLAPGALSVAEQISMFRGACVVMGAHGAGMTNIVFCEPGTAVYELLPSHYPNPCFCNLAHICDLRYWADAFVSEGAGLPNLRHWKSDTNIVIARLDELEAIVQRHANSRTISAIDFLRGMPGRVVGVETPRQQLPPAREGIFRRLVRRLFG